MEKVSFIDFLKEKNYPFGFVSSELDISSSEPSVPPSRKVFYFIRTARVPHAPYIVFFNGGPGMAVSEVFIKFNYESFLPDYNVVFFDQRGNGLSFGPSENLEELQFFSAKQIAWDAELIYSQVSQNARD